MFSLGLGLLLYHVLYYVTGVLFVLFVVVPFLMNIFDGRGYGYNVKVVGGAIGKILRLGFGKRTT